jgi:hypothetical protein
VDVEGWMRGGACGNVMHGLASLCHEAGNSGNNGGVALNMRAPYFYRTSIQNAVLETQMPFHILCPLRSKFE